MKFSTQALITLTLPSNAGPTDDRIVIDGSSDEIDFYTGATLTGKLRPGQFQTGDDLNDPDNVSYIAMEVNGTQAQLRMQVPVHDGVQFNTATFFTGDEGAPGYEAYVSMQSPSPVGGLADIGTLVVESGNVTGTTRGNVHVFGQMARDGIPVVVGGLVSATCSTNVTPSTSEQAIPGTAIALNYPFDGFLGVVAFFDCGVSTSGGGNLIHGHFRIDGVVQGGEAHQSMQTVQRLTCGQAWYFPISAGNHTFDLSVLRDGTTGAATIFAAHTRWVGLVIVN